MIKRIMSIAFVTVITLTILTIPVKAETSLISVHKYEQYLLENSIETYHQFVELNANEKEKIIELLAMPSVWLGNS